MRQFLVLQLKSKIKQQIYQHQVSQLNQHLLKHEVPKVEFYLLLVLHFLRFTYNRKLASLEKIRKSIQFEKNLSIAEYPRVSTLKHEKYELFAVEKCSSHDLQVISHIGNDLMHGHYVAYCYRLDQGWICCNDDVIREVSFQEVLQCEPYMLFYRAIEESFVC